MAIPLASLFYTHGGCQKIQSICGNNCRNFNYTVSAIFSHSADNDGT